MISNAVEDIAVNENGTGRDEMGDRIVRILITPEIAAAWLGKNLSNRNVRRLTVERYAADMLAGRWRDGDALFTVREDGVLLDGQHRASAIVLSNRPVLGWVRYVPDALRPLDLRVDTGIGRRVSDVLGIGTTHAAVARTLYAIAVKRGSGSISIDDVGEVAAKIEPEFGRITGTARRGISTANVIAAVCLSMWRYPTDSYEISGQYHAAVNDEFGSDIWSGFKSAAKTVIRMSYAGQAARSDAFLRVAKAFEPEYRHVQKLTFKDPEIFRRHVQPIVAQYAGLASTMTPVERH